MLVNPKGFTPAAKLDLEGVRKVLELRSEYGRPKKELTEVEDEDEFEDDYD